MESVLLVEVLHTVSHLRARDMRGRSHARQRGGGRRVRSGITQDKKTYPLCVTSCAGCAREAERYWERPTPTSRRRIASLLRATVVMMRVVYKKRMVSG